MLAYVTVLLNVASVQGNAAQIHVNQLVTVHQIAKLVVINVVKDIINAVKKILIMFGHAAIRNAGEIVLVVVSAFASNKKRSKTRLRATLN